MYQIMKFSSKVTKILISMRYQGFVKIPFSRMQQYVMKEKICDI